MRYAAAAVLLAAACTADPSPRPLPSPTPAAPSPGPARDTAAYAEAIEAALAGHRPVDLVLVPVTAAPPEPLRAGIAATLLPGYRVVWLTPAMDFFGQEVAFVRVGRLDDLGPGDVVVPVAVDGRPPLAVRVRWTGTAWQAG